MRELIPEELKEIETVQWGQCVPLGLRNGEPVIPTGILAHSGTDPRYAMPENLSGKTVLDVGAWDGLFSFEAERRGAKLVLANDCAATAFDNPLEKGNPGANRGFWLARRLLDSKVCFLEGSLFDLPERLAVAEFPGNFDLVLFFGVYYHLVDPLRGFQFVRKLTKPGGLALIEGAIAENGGMYMEFRPGFAEDETRITNFWYPTLPCLLEMLRLAGFPKLEVGETVGDAPYLRTTVLAYG